MYPYLDRNLFISRYIYAHLSTFITQWEEIFFVEIDVVDRWKFNQGSLNDQYDWWCDNFQIFIKMSDSLELVKVKKLPLLVKVKKLPLLWENVSFVLRTKSLNIFMIIYTVAISTNHKARFN